MFRTLAKAAPAVSLLAVASLMLVSCDSGRFSPESVPPTGEVSVAYGRWSPGPQDTCSKAIHDSYSTVGPDGKLYPTWHPPVDPATGCTFGHEHGRDPRGSDIYDEVGDVPLGYANEVLDIFDPFGPRHEDHVGHKIEWENDLQMDFSDAADPVFTMTCDVLFKLHQGTHSRDAFTNNLHELVYHLRCSDGSAWSWTVMTALGTPGEFVRSCDGAHIQVGPPTPLTSPNGGGKRIIPDRHCIEQHVLVGDGRSNFGQIRERWEVSQKLRTVDGHTLVSVNPYVNVRLPSRFHDPSKSDLTGRPIEVCYEVMNGRRASGGACEESTANGLVTGLTFDDPRSTFNGVLRDVDINAIRIANAEGPEIWYTDPFGNNARREPFAGSIRQFVAQIDNNRGANPHGGVIGRDRDHGGPGVHAPN